MKKIAGLLSLAVMMFSPAQVYAQQVATIGLGDITFSSKSSVAERPAENILAVLNTDIKAALVKTRKFTVLDNAQLTNRLDEQNRNLARYYAKQYTGNAIWQEGLDFILKADVADFGFLKQNISTKGNTIGIINIDFELLGVADVTYDFKSRVSGQFSMKINAGDKSSAGKVLDKAVQKSVDQLVDKIISSLLPIQIVKIIDDEDLDDYGDLTLNYGSGFLEVGDTVSLYSPETEVIVDELGQSVGEAVATLKVISTDQKFSIAKTLDEEKIRRGELKPLEKGQKGRLLLSRR